MPRGYKKDGTPVMKGFKHSEQTKRKISIANKGGNITSFKKGIRPWNKDKKLPQYSGKNHPNWKGGKWKSKAGYIYISIPTHPFCDKKGLILEHRLIIEKQIGRYLHKLEIVHHVNNNHSDNRIENLKLFKNRSEHMKFHRNGVRGV